MALASLIKTKELINVVLFLHFVFVGVPVDSSSSSSSSSKENLTFWILYFYINKYFLHSELSNMHPCNFTTTLI